MTYKEYVAQFIGRKGDLTVGNDGGPLFVIDAPSETDILTNVHDDFVIIKGCHEKAVPLSILTLTLYKT